MRIKLSGTITSVGFASGDRFVVGNWHTGPIGPMLDIMWAHPNGTRTLVTPNQSVLDFVSAIYEFDELIVDKSLLASTTPNAIDVTSTYFSIKFSLGRTWPIPLRHLRTPAITRYIENPIAKVLLGVRTYGVTARGIQEWYQADSYRKVVNATATQNGVSLGEMRPLKPALKVGFSEPPKQPSSVSVRPLLHDPSEPSRFAI